MSLLNVTKINQRITAILEARRKDNPKFHTKRNITRACQTIYFVVGHLDQQAGSLKMLFFFETASLL